MNISFDYGMGFTGTSWYMVVDGEFIQIANSWEEEVYNSEDEMKYVVDKAITILKSRGIEYTLPISFKHDGTV